MRAPLPADEEGRLLALRSYEILDTEPEQAFDDITLLASEICRTPAAMISLIDENRNWFKSKVGASGSETSRDLAFCAHGILQADVLVVADALEDERFAANPLVTGHPMIRFYAGAPLRTAGGHALGMLCVMDQIPRKLSPEQLAGLQALSRQVVNQLELQRTLKELERSVLQLNREQELLLRKNAFFEAQVNSSADGVLLVDQDGRQTLQNQRFIDLFGIPEQIALELTDENRLQWVTDTTKNPEEFLEKVRHLYAHPAEISRDEIELKDGTILDRYSSPVFGKNGEYYGRIWTFHDITERKRLEAHLFQSQKMETVGKLAGGIAHEFNSILTAIIGQSEILAGDLPAGSPLARNATEITTAANRAAKLTRQLLAYGRKQILQPESLDLNRVIAGMEGIFNHLMGDAVNTRIIPGRGLRMVKADAGQIEQVIMNMAINAHDAMPNGGRLTLETENVSVDGESIGRFPELAPGEYVMLAITDTGMGMTPEVKSRVFDPFFSTKSVGEGTGLGLSTCQGIVKQSGGQISVYSEVARGATFKIYLPQAELEAKAPVQRLDSADLPRGMETILLVEDDPALREMAATLLRRLGYTVLSASNGVEALSIKQQRGIGHVDLLFTDVVMPHMSGKELSERVRAANPHTRTLFTSAYTQNAIVHQGVLDQGVALLQKPFTPGALARKLREVLDSPDHGSVKAPAPLSPETVKPLPL